ncbi:hypothetical protein ABW20_dc0104611 [Dactylellina cionopaga]|nr:hypothetical protein ABW20_dc0104611 [Dactylellina cionopaga]
MRAHSQTTSALFALFYVFTCFVTVSYAVGDSAAIDVSPILKDRDAAATIDRSFISYSVEHMALPGFTKSQFTNNILNAWFSKTGGRPGVRIGGSGMDKSTFVPNQEETVKFVGKPKSQYFFGPSYFSEVANYFPKDTQVTFGLNLANTTDNWANTVEFAVAAKENIPQIKEFEIGNEVDNFVINRLRQEPWTTKEYSEQWKTVADLVKAKISDVRFQAAVYANGFKDDFNLRTLVDTGVNKDKFEIPTYSVHFYPQSFCSGRAETRLDKLVDHNLLNQQLAEFDPQIQAAVNGGGQFTFAESNTVSCSGAAGISDTFGAALWLVDYALSAAGRKVQRVYIHNAQTTPYSMFIPKATRGLETGVRPMAYGMYFLAEALALPEQNLDLRFKVTPVELPGNPGDMAVYGLYADRLQKPEGVAGGIQLVESKVRVTKTKIFEAGTSVEVKVKKTKVPKATRAEIKTLTLTKVLTAVRTMTMTTTTTIFETKTVTGSRIENGVMTIEKIVMVQGRVAMGEVVTTSRSKTTETQTIVTKVTKTEFQAKETTITKTITRKTPVTKKIVEDEIKTITTTVEGSQPSNAPEGIYLARAVVLNLSAFNTSEEAALDCRSCSDPSPKGFDSARERKRTSVTLSGFQPSHKLKLLRLQAPGLNAKSKASVSGLTFNDENGEIASEVQPESVIVDGEGKVTFGILESEGVLLVDETVK